MSVGKFRTLPGALAVVLAVMCPGAGLAENVSGWYVGIYAAHGSMDSQAFSGMSNSGTFTSNPPFLANSDNITVSGDIPADALAELNDILLALPYADGYFGGVVETEGTLGPGFSGGVGMSIGYGFGNGLRTEAELSALMGGPGAVAATGSSTLVLGDNNVIVPTSWDWTGIGFPPSDSFVESGAMDAYFALANVWYDFDTGTDITPYLGGGGGIALVRRQFDVAGNQTLTVDDESLAFAAQVGGGAKLALTDTLSIDFGYRFKSAFGLPTEVSSQTVSTSGNSTDLETFHIATPSTIGIHTVQLGVTAAFR